MQAWIGTLDAPRDRAATRFFEDFDAPAVLVPPAVAAPATYGEAELALARAEGFEAGLRHGSEQAARERGAAADAVLTAIAEALDATTQTARASVEAAAHEVARTLLGALRTMFPALCARHGAGEVAAVARAVLPRLDDEPGIVVRINPSATAAVRVELERLAPEHAARIRCVVSDTVGPADVRVEWRHGAASRDAARILDDVTLVLEACGLAGPEARA